MHHIYFYRIHPDVVGHVSASAKTENEKSIQVVNALWSAIEAPGPLSPGFGRDLRLTFHVLTDGQNEVTRVHTTLRLPNENPPDGRVLENELMSALSPVFKQAGIEVESDSLDESTDVETDFVRFDPWDLELYVNDVGSKRAMISRLFRKHRVRIRSAEAEMEQAGAGFIVAQIDRLLQHHLPDRYLSAFHSPVGKDLVLCIGGEYYSRIGRLIILPDEFREEKAAEHIVNCIDDIKSETAGWW